MTFTKEQITQALDALPKENRPVMTAIIGQLQAELKTVVESTVRQCISMVLPYNEDDTNAEKLYELADAIGEHFGVEE